MVVAVCVFTLVALVCEANAFASPSGITAQNTLGYPPQVMYQDFVRHGTFTQQYTPGELRCLLMDPTIAMHSDEETKLRLYAATRGLLGTRLERPTTDEIVVLSLVAAFLIPAGLTLGVRRVRAKRRARPQPAD
ncbi:MAG: hypothetical protein N3B14_03545 [Thermoleophilia bacterium]|nr:hypothetical protein [Thermoleophilia bacterium]